MSSWDFYAFCEANLKVPDKPLAKKHGRGVYRRFFYYVPAYGEGAVNYNIPRWTKIKDSNGLHQIIGGVLAGMVEVRGRSCHCVPCYNGDYDNCMFSKFMMQEMMWEQPDDLEIEFGGRRPELRGDQEKKGHAMAMNAKVGDWAAFLVHNQEAWMIGKILAPKLGCVAMGTVEPTMAIATSVEGMVDGQLSLVVQTTTRAIPEKSNWMGTLEIGDDIVYVEKWEARATRGSSRNEFVRTNKRFGCYSGDTRHVGFSMRMKPASKTTACSAPTRKSKRGHALAQAPSTKAPSPPKQDASIACLSQGDKDIILFSLASTT